MVEVFKARKNERQPMTAAAGSPIVPTTREVIHRGLVIITERYLRGFALS
jgi:hypothetical protein